LDRFVLAASAADLRGGREGLNGALDSPDKSKVFLRPRLDPRANRFQWFYADLTPHPHAEYITIEVTRAYFPEAFDGHCVWQSFDGEEWFTVGSAFNWPHISFERLGKLVAYCAPYTSKERQRLLHALPNDDRVRISSAIQSSGPVISIGAGQKGLPHVLILARQHGGETPAEWFADELCRAALKSAHDLPFRLTVLPVVNYEGAIEGFMRTDARGLDLNRAWNSVPPPAGLGVAHELLDGTTLFIDVHADEFAEVPFLVAAQGSDIDARVHGSLEALLNAIQAKCQWQIRSKFVDADHRGISVNWAASTQNLPAFMLELPLRYPIGFEGTPAAGAATVFLHALAAAFSSSLGCVS
jgi:hypothetical protein